MKSLLTNLYRVIYSVLVLTWNFVATCSDMLSEKREDICQTNMFKLEENGNAVWEYKL
jgi:hypothetical protein